VGVGRGGGLGGGEKKGVKRGGEIAVGERGRDTGWTRERREAMGGREGGGSRCI